MVVIGPTCLRKPILRLINHHHDSDSCHIGLYPYFLIDLTSTCILYQSPIGQIRNGWCTMDMWVTLCTFKLCWLEQMYDLQLVSFH